MSLQRGFLLEEPSGAKILCVIARFTTRLLAKIQPESTSFIPKFTGYPAQFKRIMGKIAICSGDRLFSYVSV